MAAIGGYTAISKEKILGCPLLLGFNLRAAVRLAVATQPLPPRMSHGDLLDRVTSNPTEEACLKTSLSVPGWGVGGDD